MQIRRILGTIALGTLAACSSPAPGPGVPSGRMPATLRVPAGGHADLPRPPGGRADRLTVVDHGVLATDDPIGLPPSGPSLPTFQYFDLRTGRWRTLPEPPLGPYVIDPPVSPVEHGFLAFGRECDAVVADPDMEDATLCSRGRIVGARFDLPSNTWRRLHLPALPAGDDAARAHGAIFGRADRRLRLATVGSATYTFDVASDTFRAVDAEPGRSISCAIGPTFVTARNATDDRTAAARGGPAPTTSSYSTSVLSGTSWADLPTPPPRSLADTSAVLCTNAGVLVLGANAGAGNRYSFALDARDEAWRSVADLDVPVDGAISAVAPDGAIVVVPGRRAMRFRDRDGSWRPVNPTLEDMSSGFVVVDGLAVGRLSPDGANSRLVAVSLER